MHHNSLEKWQHSHKFILDNTKNQGRTRLVLAITLMVMVIEIVSGLAFNSMALLADGWHMATDAAALCIALYAYHFSNKHINNPEYAFGTGKVSVLGGFTSAIALTLIAIYMVIESVGRILSPHNIDYNGAIAIVSLGLVVNLCSAFILHDHHHSHNHGDTHHQHQDHNLKAAYYHVLADTLTSFLAIIVLIIAKYTGLNWLDSVAGIIGGLIIFSWSISLIKSTSPILLDSSINEDYRKQIQTRIEQDKDNRIADFHIWNISANHYAAIISIVTDEPQPTSYYKALLSDFDRLSHLTIEVHQCEDAPCTH